MKIDLHPQFKKSYKNRIASNSKLVKQTSKRIELFRANPKHPILRNHPLAGTKKGFRSFSITGDVRVIYFHRSESLVIFFDIGTHNQVY